MSVIKSKMSTREIDKGFKEFQNQVQRMKREPIIKAGILAEDANKETDGPLNLAGIAAVNEFGTNRAGPNRNTVIPERSFIRSTMDSERATFIRMTKNALTNISLGGDIFRELGRIGLAISSAIKKTITDLRDPANSPRTIAGKGSSNPLIDKGRMRASINHKVVFSDEEG